MHSIPSPLPFPPPPQAPAGFLLSKCFHRMQRPLEKLHSRQATAVIQVCFHAVQPLSKRCPSTIQALSKQVHLLSKLGSGACPNLCVYAVLEVREVRPSSHFIILKAMRAENIPRFAHGPKSSRILQKAFDQSRILPDTCEV